MKNNSSPDHLQNVMVAYKKRFYFGEYNMQSKDEVVTKLGFFDKLENLFIIPPKWSKFKGVLLPDGFGGDRKNPENIIEWKEYTA